MKNQNPYQTHLFMTNLNPDPTSPPYKKHNPSPAFLTLLISLIKFPSLKTRKNKSHKNANKPTSKNNQTHVNHIRSMQIHYRSKKVRIFNGKIKEKAHTYPS
jgi:hypothetical protein